MSVTEDSRHDCMNDIARGGELPALFIIHAWLLSSTIYLLTY